MHSPLISIIIPVYNVEQYLRQCLDSIVQQPFSDYEVILVDDGSSDGSPAICDEYAERYSQVKTVHKTNGGVSSARNAGLDIANGSWIWFVDADDWINIKSMKILAKAVESHSCDMVYFGLAQVADNAISTNKSHDRWGINKNTFLRMVVCNTHQSILYQHRIINRNQIRFTVGMKMSEDLEFQYKYLLHCDKPIEIEPTLYYLRIREGSASHNPETTKNSFFCNKLILSNMLEYLSLCKDKGVGWLGLRIEDRIKNYMKAYSKLNGINRNEVQKDVRHFIREFKKIGYPELASKTMLLSFIDIRLYILLYRIRLLLR